MLPIEVTPKPLAPSVEPPPAPLSIVKPAGMTEVKPNVPESVPRTNFDVDLHNPTAGDSYESISQEFYNDKRFAAALKAYNKNLSLQGGRYVEVPPLHVLRRRYPTQSGSGTPVGSSGIPPATTWGAPNNATDPTPRATGNRGTFVVPQGGQTIRDVAKQTGVNWGDIYDLNPQYAPNVLIPAGTELKLPANARP
jgi:hypothetical protein